MEERKHKVTFPPSTEEKFKLALEKVEKELTAMSRPQLFDGLLTLFLNGQLRFSEQRTPAHYMYGYDWAKGEEASARVRAFFESDSGKLVSFEKGVFPDQPVPEGGTPPPRSSNPPPLISTRASRASRARETEEDAAVTALLRQSGEKTHVPDPFPVTPQMTSWAKLRLGELDLIEETEKMVEHFTLKNPEKRDGWLLTWYRWMRTAKKYQLAEEARSPKPKSWNDETLPQEAREADWETVEEK